MGLENWNTLEELQEQITLRSADPSELYRKLKNSLKYDIVYAEDRVTQLTEHWDENLYIDSVSSRGFKAKQVKKASDGLSETEFTLTNHIDRLANYIIYCSFDNKEDRAVYEELKEKKKEAREISNTNKKIEKNLEIRDKQKTRLSLISNVRPPRTKFSFASLDGMQEDNKDYDANSETHTLTHYTFTDRELNQSGTFKNSEKYWEHYGQHNRSGLPPIFQKVSSSLKYPDFAYQDLLEREEIRNKIKGKIEQYPDKSSEKKKFEGIMRVIKRDYIYASEVWRNPMKFKPSKLTQPVDPLLSIERRITYTDKDIIKELVYNYADLKTVHWKNTSGVIWAALMDIEITLSKIKLSETQKYIINDILKNNNWSLKEIKQLVLRDLYQDMSEQGIAYHINSCIKKITEYYIEKELITNVKN